MLAGLEKVGYFESPSDRVNLPPPRSVSEPSMFESLERLPEDAILGLMAAYRADSDPDKVDLGVGVYRDEHGETPILSAVRRAEAAVLARQTTKSYVSPIGNAGFNRALETLVLGDAHSALDAGRVRTIQTAGAVRRCGSGRSSSRSQLPRRSSI